jgi:small subunit ribosomal protein S6
VREYELMLVLDPTLDEEATKSATDRVGVFVSGRGGEVLGIDPLGRRRMAYAISRHRDAIYTIARFKVAPSAAEELDRQLKLNEQVLRHLMIRKD